jgi:hypothetical protein
MTAAGGQELAHQASRMRALADLGLTRLATPGIPA